MDVNNVTVCGSEVLGSQIAYQADFHGFNVLLYDLKYELLEKAKEKFEELSKIYRRNANASQQEVENTIKRISYSTNLAEVVALTPERGLLQLCLMKANRDRSSKIH